MSSLAPRFRLRIAYLREVCWSVLRVRNPFLVELSVENLAPEAGRFSIRLEVWGQDRLLARSPQLSWNLDPGQRSPDWDGELEWSWDLAYVFRETCPGELQVIVHQSSGPGAPDFRQELSLPLQVLSGKEWCFGLRAAEGGGCEPFAELPCCELVLDLPEPRPPQPRFADRDIPHPERLFLSTAAIVQHDHPAVRQLVADTYRAMMRAAPYRTFRPHALLATREGCAKLLEGVYATLLHQHPFHHAIEDIGFSSWTQRVRLPEEILAPAPVAPNPVESTCIDLAVLCAAAYARMGLRPVLALLPVRGGVLHAVPGAWLSGPPGAALQFGGDALRRLTAGREANLLLVDPTCTDGFRQAVEQVLRLLREGDGTAFAVDLAAAWESGITPLPWHSDPLLHASGFEPSYVPQIRGRVLLDLAAEAGGATTALNPGAIYVPIQCNVDGGPGPADLLRVLDRALQRGGRRFAILGNPGTGKSHALGRILLRKGLRFAAAPDRAPIPVLFPLKQLRSRAAHDLVTQIQHHLQSFGYPVEPAADFRRKIEKGRFLFLLDGLDELMLSGASDIAEYMRPLRPLLDIEPAVVVLTARSGLFGARAREALRELEILELREWGEESWQDFFSQCVGHGVLTQQERDRFTALIAASGSTLKALVRKPLYCRMLVETKDWLDDGAAVNEADLFRRYIKRHIEDKPIPNDFLSRPQKVDWMETLALRMERLHKGALEVSEIAEMLSRHYAKTGNPEDWRRHLLSVRVYGFLENDLTDLCYFSHEAFREFFLAARLIADLFETDVFGYSDRLPRKPATAWKDLGSLAISFEVARFLAGLLASLPDSALRLRQWMGTDPRRKDLWKGGDPQVTLRNLALVYALATGECSAARLEDLDFSSLVLRSIDFGGSHLGRARFVASDVAGSSFRDADLTAADFSYARLDGVDFRGADLTGAAFARVGLGEATARFSGARGVTSAIWSPDAAEGLARCLDAELGAMEPVEPFRADWLRRHLEVLGHA